MIHAMHALLRQMSKAWFLQLQCWYHQSVASVPFPLRVCTACGQAPGDLPHVLLQCPHPAITAARARYGIPDNATCTLCSGSSSWHTALAHACTSSSSVSCFGHQCWPKLPGRLTVNSIQSNRLQLVSNSICTRYICNMMLAVQIHPDTRD
jgi:hypothetical protein